jgi:hypothetical protein
MAPEHTSIEFPNSRLRTCPRPFRSLTDPRWLSLRHEGRAARRVGTPFQEPFESVEVVDPILTTALFQRREVSPVCRLDLAANVTLVDPPAPVFCSFGSVPG